MIEPKLVVHRSYGASLTKPTQFTQPSEQLDEHENVMWTPKPVNFLEPKPVSMDMWTDRLGGSSTNSIVKLDKRKSLGKITTKTLSNTKLMLQSQANQKAKPHKGQMPRCSLPGYKMWGDEQGPNVKSFFHHYRYVFGWLDDATNFGIVFFGKTKSEVLDSFRKLKAWCPHKIHAITTDGAKEYFSGELQQFAINADIYWTCSPPYVPQRNSRIEHWWYRTDVLTRYMLARCGASKIFWAFAKAYACLIVNVREYGPTGQIPFEHFMKQRFSYGKLRVFGCTVLIRHMTSRDQSTATFQKYNNKSQFGFYLGFDFMTHKHITYGLDTKRLHEGADFDPFESNFHALHLFQTRNPSIAIINEDKELQDLRKEVESQGEIFDETQLPSNPFGISRESREIWNKTNQKHHVCIDSPSVEPTDSTTRLEEEEPQTTTPQDNSTQPAQGVSPQQREEPPINDGGTSTQPTSVNQPMPTREIAPEADPMEVQERVIQGSGGVEPRTTRQQDKDPNDPRTRFDPTIPTSTANKEVQRLADQNSKLSGLSNWVIHMTSLMTIDPMQTNEQKLELKWQNNVEYAMHAFMVQGISENGFWTEFSLKKGHKHGNAKRRRQDSSIPLMETALPTVDGLEPQSIKQLKNWPEGHKYMEATEAEMQGHKLNGTFDPCELPEGVKAIDTRMVYVRKVNPDNTIRYKARWVARGFTQVHGENFNWDTIFAPVLRMTSLRWLFSLIAEYNLEVTSADVVQAFLQSDLKESDELKDIYVKLPDGYQVTCPTTGKELKYGRLIKALYGLKQAPRRWAEKLTGVMKKIGFKPHPEDPCIFILREGKSIAIYGIYVDDMIKATNDPALRKRIDAILSKELNIEHQGELKEFLGLQFSWKTSSSGKRYLNISQEKYCNKILTRFGMDKCNSTTIPCKASGQPKEIYMWPNPEPPENVDQELLGRYRAGIGALIYLSVMSRPDISYAVGAAAQFMSNPNSEHEQALWKIFRYLKDTQHYSLKYFKNDENGGGMTMLSYVDANFMGDHDSRSVTGRIIFSGNGIIDWGSNRQTVIATSTSHAECTAFFEATKHVIYVRKLVKSFDMPQKVTSQPTTMFCDNSACVELVRKRNENPNRTKHWQMQWNWLHEQRDQFHQFIPIFKEGKMNWADAFTKPLTKEVHLTYVKAMKLNDV